MERSDFHASVIRLTVLVIGYHILAFSLIQALEQVLHGSWFTGNSLMHWDALHYEWIAEHGYVSFRQAFFPLLPLVWRGFAMSLLGVSALNTTLYLATLILLGWHLNASHKVLLMWMLLPSVVFYFVPYTESMFFAGSVIVLIAMKHDSRSWVSLGILLCTLSRPAFSTLLPSVLLASFLSKNDRREFMKDTGTYLFVSAIGLSMVSLIQHHFTNEWWGFFTAQQTWGNSLRIPRLPLSSWGGNAVTYLDAVALLCGSISLTYVGHALKCRFTQNAHMPPIEVILSAGCTASISMLTLFFRGGELFSLNRFVFATPFALVLLHYTSMNLKPFSRKSYTWILLLLLAYFMIFGAYVHIQAFLKYMALSLYLLLFIGVVPNERPSSSWLFWAWVILAFAIQYHFTSSFLHNGWVG